MATFTKEDYHRLRKLLKPHPSSWATIVVIIFDALAVLVAAKLSSSDNLLTFMFSQVLYTTIFFHAFAIVHECGHGNVFRYSGSNAILGHVASVFCLMPYYSWKYIHHKHHVWTGNVERDPTLKMIRDYDPTNMPRNAVLRLLWKCWVPGLAFFQHIVLWTYPLTGYLAGELKARKLSQCIFSVVFMLSCLIALAWLFPEQMRPARLWLAVLLYLFITELINFPHHLGMPLFTDANKCLPLWRQAQVTRSCYFPVGLSECLLLNFNFHTEHHIFPDLPWNQLRSARRELMQALRENYTEEIGIEWNIKNRSRDLFHVVIPQESSTSGEEANAVADFTIKNDSPDSSSQ